MGDFVHLHVHSHYSLLNGLTKVKALVKAAKKQGYTALALTDYGSMYGAIEFYQACLSEGIKPIIGFEAYVAPRSRFDKDPTIDSGVHHLVLLAENYNGYKNLITIKKVFAGSLSHPKFPESLVRQCSLYVAGCRNFLYIYSSFPFIAFSNSGSFVIFA